MIRFEKSALQKADFFMFRTDVAAAGCVPFYTTQQKAADELRLVSVSDCIGVRQAAIERLANTFVRIFRSKGFNRKSSAPARLPAIIFLRSASTTQ